MPRNPLWYIAVTALLGPYLAIYFLEPDWLIRYITTSIFLVGVSSGCLTAGLSRGVYELTKIKSKWLNKKFGEPATRADFVGRAILFTVGVCGLIYFLPPIIKDSNSILQGDAPRVSSDVIVESDYHIIVKSIRPSSSDEYYFAWHFPPRSFKLGDTYELKYLPNTKFILEAKLINKQ